LIEYSDELIDKIVESIDLVQYVSQYTTLERDNKSYFGICPLHEETDSSFSIPVGKSYYYCFGCKKGGNIINFIMNYEKKSFGESVEKLLRLTGNIEFVENKSQTFKFLKNMKKIKTKNKNKIDRSFLSMDVMKKYKKINIQEWIDEGISQEVMDKYNVRYDDMGKRIVFPVWDNVGNIISIKGRTTVVNFKDLKLRKYTYYQPIQTNDFLWGYYQKKDIIKQKGEVLIFEGSKSVMKVESWGIDNAVSLETSSINYEQLKDLVSLKVNIVLALDKGIDIEAIKKEIQPLKKFTNVYAIIDTDNLIENKASPCDHGYYVFQDLYEQKIKL